MPEDPWRELDAPGLSSAINARRVDATNKWDVFWALDHDRRCLLILQHSSAVTGHPRLPRLRDLELRSETLHDGQPMLVLCLLAPAFRDVFFRLCMDIAEATMRTVTEAEAVDAFIARTWRWHHLLRGGGDGRLRPEEQKGLIGELLVLERYFLPAMGPAAAIAAWIGPVGAAKDFVHNSVAVESKARSDADLGVVPISSEFQLADEDLTELFIHLSVLDPAIPGEEGAFTLTEVATRVRDTLADGDEAAMLRYDALLTAAGFQFEDDYSDSAWFGGERSIYRVTDGFPRLVPGNIPTAISGLRYMLSLTGAGPYLAAACDLQLALTKGA